MAVTETLQPGERRPIGEVMASLFTRATQFLSGLFVDQQTYYRELMAREGGYKAELHTGGGEVIPLRYGGKSTQK